MNRLLMQRPVNAKQYLNVKNNFLIVINFKYYGKIKSDHAADELHDRFSDDLLPKGSGFAGHHQ